MTCAARCAVGPQRLIGILGALVALHAGWKHPPMPVVIEPGVDSGLLTAELARFSPRHTR